ncbi:TPA: hypothetical protein ACH3X1_004809 [Trebouxia sp. C0004]
MRSTWAPSTKLAARAFSSAPAAAEIPNSWRNPAAVLHGIDDIRFEDVSLPDKVADGHVRVQMRAVGICGSDVHYYKKGRVGHFVVNAPMVLGHESAGDIIECGPGVTSRQVGDRVALEPGVPCWSNRMSRQGRYNLDPDVKFFATPPVHGSLARFVDHPADFCFKMPDSLSYEQGAMVEPLSNAVHACRRGGVGPGKKVAILGAGPIGLMVLAAAKAFSASSVAITDIRPDNLPVAKQLGAKHALDQSKATSARDTVEALKAVFAEGPDIVIDCVGFESTITVSLQSLVYVSRVLNSSSSSSSRLRPCYDRYVIAGKHVSHASRSITFMLFGGPAMGTASSVLCICFGGSNDSCAAGESCIGVTACCCEALTSSFICTHAEAFTVLTTESSCPP